MLFGYPIAATAENWLHNCLVEMLTTIHANIEAGTAPAKWPDIIPVLHREALRKRWGLRNRLITYREAVSALAPEKRRQIKNCLTQQNRIRDLCGCVEDCDALDDLPPACHIPIRNLFDFAFSLLTEIGVRDRHYAIIFNADTYHVCPFCGCEYFDAPGAPREDLDHYLPKSRYPFAAANLRNLVPMGMRCNQRYKLAEDILKGDGGARRHAFDPYSERRVEIQLNGSVPFAGLDGKKPNWAVEFEPDSPECSTWDVVFHVRERIQRDVLDPSFFRWLREFAVWFKRRIGHPNPDAATVQDALLTYAEDMAILGLNAREFLRAPVFRMLHFHCSNGDHRLRKLMIDLVSIDGAV